ncbi:MAG: ABC transporter permease [Clostridiaceae bacterium]
MKILGYIIKDLRIAKRDILTYIIAYLIFPIAMSFFYGYFQDRTFKANYQVDKFTLAIEDNDNSNNSKMIKTIFQNEEFKNTFTIDDKTPDITVVIPEGFEKSILIGEPSTIEIKASKKEMAIQENMVKGILDGFAKNMSMVSSVSKEIYKSNLNESEKVRLLNEYTKKISDAMKTSSVKPEILESNGKLNSREYYSISILAFISMILIINFSQEYLKERKDGTLRRIAATSTNGGKLFLGKLISFFIIAVIDITAYVLFYRILGISFKQNIVLLMMAVIGNALFISLLSGLIISIFKDEKVMKIVINALIFLSISVGGSFFPLDIIDNKFLNIASNLSPSTWIVALYKKPMIENSFASMVPALELLAIVVLVCFVIGNVRMNRRWEE